jgi:hypothetical protein
MGSLVRRGECRWPRPPNHLPTRVASDENFSPDVPLKHSRQDAGGLVRRLSETFGKTNRLCQVCAQSVVDKETGRIWWLPASDGEECGDGFTNAPPTCKACIPEAITYCSHLRRHAASAPEDSPG